MKTCAMYQRDFIMRMIEMIGQLIAGILGRIQKGDFKGAAEAIDQAYHDVLREDAAFFNSIPAEELTHELMQQHNYTHGHLEVLAELFYAQAELSHAEGNHAKSCKYYVKAEILLKHLIAESNTFSFEQQEKLTYLQNRILDLKKKE